MTWKKLYKTLLFPHIAILIALVPISTVFLVCSMVFLGSESLISIISYVLSAYMLTAVCFRTPDIIRFVKHIRNENVLVLRLRNDTKLRINVTLYASVAMNVIYAVFQLCLGVFHGSFWYYSLSGYYAALATMRFALLKYTRAHNAGESLAAELKKYRDCGWFFLTVNLMLSAIVIFMIRFDRTFNHHEITTIAIAAYTFTAFTLAIINVVKYRKYNSPAYSASKAISLAAASVSILTLESTMLTTFGAGEADKLMRRILLGISGGVISVFLILMALYVIIQSTKRLNLLKLKETTNGQQ